MATFRVVVLVGTAVGASIVGVLVARNYISKRKFAKARSKWASDTVTNKSPWVTINGEEFFDSQLIVEMLTKKFRKDLSGHLSAKERVVARSFRIMLEDHFYWVLMCDRYVDEQARHMSQFLSLGDGPAFEMYRRKAVKKLTQQAYGQGLMRLGRGHVQKMGIEDLEAISTFLGSKTWLMGGEKPTEVDCVLFGFVAIVVYTTKEGSIYRTLVEKRLTNLYQHMQRIKSEYYQDWNELIQGQREKEIVEQQCQSSKKDEKKAEPPPRPATKPDRSQARSKK